MLFHEPHLGPHPHVGRRELRLPSQLLQNRLKPLGRIVHTTARSTRLRANIWEEEGEKAAGNLVEVGVRNSSIVVLVVLVRIHGLLQCFGAGSFPTSIVEITRGRSGRL